MAAVSLRTVRSVPSPNELKRKGRPSSSSWPLWGKLVLISMALYVVFLAYFIFSLEFDGEKETSTSNVEIGGMSSLKDGSKTSSTYATEKQEASQSAQKRVIISQPYANTIPLPTFNFDRNKAEGALARYGSSAIRKTVTAYLERSFNDTIPGTGNQGRVNQDGDPGVPPDFIIPLPLRTTSPDDLLQFQYPKLQTCHDMPGKIPVDRGLEIDKRGNTIVWNIGDDPTPDDYPILEAPHCPVEADPFLPWLHDVFPSVDGTSIHFIAQNKRRCKTGKHFEKDLKRLEPQVTLMQPISVQRIDERQARNLAPELWHPHDDGTNTSLPRYRLAPFEESADDGRYTRFICRFHAVDFSDGGRPRTLILGETLSTYPFNYEFVSYRKMKPTMITPKGKDTKFFWLSNLHFECPVPSLVNLPQMISTGDTILSDGTPTLHVDIVPIRTSPRFGTDEVYFTEDLAGPKENWGDGEWKAFWRNPKEKIKGFDPKVRWGNRNVMPRIEASGRWTNIPICLPPKVPLDDSSTSVTEKAPHRRRASVRKQEKPHLLSACVWAAASFRTRGTRKGPIKDTLDRLEEWIEFHLMAGFDHIYVYDNSGAQTNETSLAPILDKYPPSKVTRIDWPSIVCNNNIPAHDNTGERSSQYAAENSCRTRFAPYTEWIASFDIDEYLVPMGKYTSLRDVVTNAAKKHTNILTFRSSRSRLHVDYSEESEDERVMLSNATFLEAYNCDSSPSPKPTWADRARKQVYRADYVLYHFVHYSTVTQGMVQTYKESPTNWNRPYGEGARSERVTDEVNEAVMLHTKTLTPDQARSWRKRCHYKFEKKWMGCHIGFPWPNSTEATGEGSRREDGMEYNCFENEKITNYWGPRLRDALAKRPK